jgi:hypothetical protein
MKESYGYGYSHMLTVVVGVAVTLLWISYTDGVPPLVLIGIVSLPPIVGALAVICKVRVTEEELIVSYLLPIRKRKNLSHVDVEYYTPWIFDKKGQKPFAGTIKSRTEKKPFVIWGFGVKKFERLSRLLESIYPKYENTQPVGGANGFPLRGKP